MKAVKIHNVAKSAYCSNLTNSVNSLVDGHAYDLGAIHGVYNAESDTFSLGSGFVHRSQTIYSNK